MIREITGTGELIIAIMVIGLIHLLEITGRTGNPRVKGMVDLNETPRPQAENNTGKKAIDFLIHYFVILCILNYPYINYVYSYKLGINKNLFLLGIN
jgi:hypothetical protein